MRTGHSGAKVLLVLLLAVVGAALVAWQLYERYVHYERTALRFVPNDTSAVLAADLTQVTLYEPFRQHLLPLAEAGQPEALRPRLERLEHHTRVDLGVDVRELVVARVGDEGWLLALGGMFPLTGVAEGLSRAMAEEGWSWEPVAGGYQAPGGFWVAQAPSGVVLLATSAALGSRALEGQGATGRMGLDSEAPASFGLTPGGMTAALDGGRGASREQVELRGRVDLSPEEISWTLIGTRPAQAELRRMAAALEEAMGLFQATVLPNPPDRLGIRAPLDQETADTCALRLAQAVREAFAPSVAADRAELRPKQR